MLGYTERRVTESVGGIEIANHKSQLSRKAKSIQMFMLRVTKMVLYDFGIRKLLLL